MVGDLTPLVGGLTPHEKDLHIFNEFLKLKKKLENKQKYFSSYFLNAGIE